MANEGRPCRPGRARPAPPRREGPQGPDVPGSAAEPGACPTLPCPHRAWPAASGPAFPTPARSCPAPGPSRPPARPSLSCRRAGPRPSPLSSLPPPQPLAPFRSAAARRGLPPLLPHRRRRSLKQRLPPAPARSLSPEPPSDPRSRRHRARCPRRYLFPGRPAGAVAEAPLPPRTELRFRRSCSRRIGPGRPHPPRRSPTPLAAAALPAGPLGDVVRARSPAGEDRARRAMASLGALLALSRTVSWGRQEWASCLPSAGPRCPHPSRCGRRGCPAGPARAPQAWASLALLPLLTSERRRPEPALHTGHRAPPAPRYSRYRYRNASADTSR